MLEIVDPEIDPKQIMFDIRKRMQAERKARKYAENEFPKFGEITMPEEIDELNIDPELLRYLQQANDSFPLADTGMMLFESPATRLPLIGRLWKMIRAGAHQLILFYVNRNVTHQLTVNHNVVNVLNKLTFLLQEQQQSINDLRAELETLRRQ